jgi:hypothetical protein
MYGCTTATGENVALGLDVGVGLASNVYIGYRAGAAAPAGVSSSNNVAIGNRAGREITTGSSNTLVGRSAGQSMVTASCNTLIGANAGLTGPGGGNVMIGVNAGAQANSSHTNSILIGVNAGCNYISCGCSIIIGNGSSNTGNINSRTLILGNNISFDSSDCAVIGKGGGQCAKFSMTFGIGWDFVSDARLKDGVTALPVRAESFINALRPVSFCFLDKETKQPLDNKHCNVGFIAQEVEKALEDHGFSEITSLVTKPRNEDDYYNLTDAGFTPFIVKALQELSDKVSALQNEVNALKAKE